MTVSLEALNVQKLRADCAVIPVHKGKLGVTGSEIDDSAGGALSAAVKSGELAAKVGSTLLLPVDGKTVSRVVLVSFGDADLVTEKQFLDATRAGFRALLGTRAEKAISCMHEVPAAERDLSWKVGQTTLIARDLCYRFDEYRSKKDAPVPPLKSIGLPVDRTAVDHAGIVIAQMSALADAIDRTKDYANTPPNVCNPSWLADEARKLGRKHKLKCEVHDVPALQKLGMNALLAVGQGSEQPPRMITLHYKGAGAKEAPYVLVGKGITFDSGGISIKPAADMDEMKFDMCGAATVLGVMQAVAAMKLPINLVCVVVAAENMPSGNATRPGDIVTTMSGQTVEILNTDAEGRLVLCDALTYVERYKPRAVVDIATLTGACVIALGHVHAGLFTSDDDLAARLLECGRTMNDTCWRMPIDEIYQEGLRSSFADMGNVGPRPGGAITAACFLARFTKAYPWAHLDIAGVGWKSGAKVASGRPVAMLTRWLMEQSV